MKRWISGALCLLLLLGLGLSFPAHAEDAKVVRVGWFESTYCYHDQNGERRGIAYEYQQKVAAHTGWTYDYVEDSWPNLMQMLIDGEIDLLSDVSNMEDRAELILYPSLPMGAESYYIYIDADNTEINPEDLQTFNGKKIGVNRGSFQQGLLETWAERNGLSVRIEPLTEDEAFFLADLENGVLDAIVTMDSFGAMGRVIPVTKIGSSDYYLAVNKARPDLLAELNSAMSAIQDEDPYINQRMLDEYIHLTRANAFLPPYQEEWLAGHGAIRVGYLEDCMPFCGTDEATGALTGALSDWLNHASNLLKNAQIEFTATPYATTEDALTALRRGEIDCVFPLNLSTYRSEKLGVRMIDTVMKTEMSVLVRTENRTEITPGKPLTVAMEVGNLTDETLVRDNLPSWNIAFYPDMNACFRAVADGEADGFLANNYRSNAFGPLQEKYKLTALPTGETMDLSFAITAGNPALYSILNKLANLSEQTDMEYALVSYMYSDQKVSLMEFLEDNWLGVLAALAAVFLVILFLLVQKLRAEWKANEQQHLLEEAAEIAKLQKTIASLLDNMPGMSYTKDAETGVYLACNQAFATYARRKTPAEVVGKTAAELFDAGTAERTAEDDRMALSMDEPYIFFEDVRDAAGSKRQIKTTKLKYTDAEGRLCVLGINQDMTDSVRIERESATTKEAYEKARSTGIIFSQIAQALARGYEELYYIHLDTEEYVEYCPDERTGMLTEQRRGWHFFESCLDEAEQTVYPDDRAAVLRALDRKTLEESLDRDKSFDMTYRLIGAAGPRYVSMRVTRLEDDDRTIILGVTDVDETMQQRRAAERVKEEHLAYTRLHALIGDYLCVYVVEPESGRYREFSAAARYAAFAQAKEGPDFFASARNAVAGFCAPDDRSRVLAALTRDNILDEIARSGIYTLSYRLLMDGEPRYVQFKAAMVEEKEGRRLIVGLSDIDAQVRQEEAYVRTLAQARIEASVDALTGVKNRHAYLMAEERLNIQIAEGRAPAFAVSVLDVNDLKQVNDNEGHEAGDQLLRGACRLICEVFPHSPVFRIGGDEFAVISQGGDYEQIDDLVRRIEEHNRQALAEGGIVVACGMAKQEADTSVGAVFERADERMYENKRALKAQRKGGQP